MADPEQREQESRLEDEDKFHQRREQEQRERDLVADEIQRDAPLTERDD